jgi:hypothetical protein
MESQQETSLSLNLGGLDTLSLQESSYSLLTSHGLLTEKHPLDELGPSFVVVFLTLIISP